MNSQPTFRLATRDDVDALVAMLADDDLGRQRERYVQPLPQAYLDAWSQFEHDPNNEILVAEIDGQLAGMLQFTLIPSLSFQGRPRALVESVRVRADVRGQGIGGQLMRFAIDRARQKGCHVMQLTTHNSRHDAHRFYARLGFQATHQGMKLGLDGTKG